MLLEVKNQLQGNRRRRLVAGDEVGSAGEGIFYLAVFTGARSEDVNEKGIGGDSWGDG